MSDVTLSGVSAYLSEYILRYREAYQRLTDSPPKGAGYPTRDSLSTYLDDSAIQCLLGADGWAIVDYAGRPRHQDWHIVGGPAMMIDYEPTVVPQHIRRMLVAQDLLDKNIGIFRIVSPQKLPIEVWTGSFPLPLEQSESPCSGKSVHIKRYSLSLDDILARLTFGVTSALDFLIGSNEAPFWMTRKVRNLGYTTADRAHRRFLRYLEIGRHLNVAAWDPRSALTRVGMDLRDYASDLLPGSTITFLGPAAQGFPLDKTLLSLAAAMSGLSTLLDSQAIDNEDVYHHFLLEHPILLDVYGQIASKPRFYYPDGSSPINKKYVEPDFVISYPGQTYRLVELERPGKHLDTVRGETRAHLTQSAFQIGEWRDFISRHPDQLTKDFPGLVAGNYTTTIIIGRDRLLQDGRVADRYLSLVRQQLAVDEVLTYDALLNRARTAYARLAGLAA